MNCYSTSCPLYLGPKTMYPFSSHTNIYSPLLRPVPACMFSQKIPPSTIIAPSTCFQKQHLRISSPNDPLLPQVEEAKTIILSLTSHAASFVHDYNTCLNESFNSSWTKDVPKHWSFPLTYSSCCCFSLLRQNLGPGGALCAIWRALGLQVSAPLQHHAQLEDKRWEKDRKRKCSKEFHKRERELQRQEIQQNRRGKNQRGKGMSTWTGTRRQHSNHGTRYLP